MVRLSITKLADKLAVLQKGNYYVCMNDSRIDVLCSPKGIMMFPFVKYTDNLTVIRKDLYDSMLRVSVCENDLFEEYLEIEGYIVNTKKPLIIRYNNNSNHWCSISKTEKK